MSRQLREYGAINAWIQKLDHRRLVPEIREKSSTFKKYNRNTVICQTVLILVASMLGGYRFHFGYLMSTCYLLLTTLTGSLYLLVMAQMDNVAQLLTSELRPYLSRWNIVRGMTPLTTHDSREAFFSISRRTYRLCNTCVRCCRASGGILFFYIAFCFIRDEASLFSVFSWNFWTVIQASFIWVQQSNILWFIAIWYLINAHLLLEMDQLTMSTRKCLQLNTPELQIELVKVFDSYESLSIRTARFGNFSKKLSAILISGNMAFISILAYATWRLGYSHPINSYFYVFCLTGFLFMTTVCLNVTASIWRKRQRQYQSFNQVFVRKKGMLSRAFRHKLQIIIKDSASRTCSTFAVSNIAGNDIASGLYLMSLLKFFTMTVRLLAFK